jgi:hypothetical protein
MIDNNTGKSWIRIVSNFEDFISTPFVDGINAVCWNRELAGDFFEVISKCTFAENMISLHEDALIALQLTDQGQVARSTLINDLRLLSAQGLLPTLNIIKHYHRDAIFPFFPTDVYSWHIDRSSLPGSTILCTYFGAASEIVANDQAKQKILIPAFRDKLKLLHQGVDESFDPFLVDNFFDLHYQIKDGAQIINLGKGNMWRLAIDHPGCKVLPCIHRAPVEKNGEPRLMMIC